MGLPRYAELTHVNRGAPCAEYPGTWVVYRAGGIAANEEEAHYETMAEAVASARGLGEEGVRAHVCWSCSDNDPRIGQVWFTPFYRHCTFDSFGRREDL